VGKNNRATGPPKTWSQEGRHRRALINHRSAKTWFAAAQVQGRSSAHFENTHTNTPAWASSSVGAAISDERHILQVERCSGPFAGFKFAVPDQIPTQPSSITAAKQTGQMPGTRFGDALIRRSISWRFSSRLRGKPRR
jgi:hypothetical protein